MQTRPLTFFANAAFQRLSDYVELMPLQSRPDRTHFIAKEKQLTAYDHVQYDERCFILMRDGLFKAQVEKVMAEMYAYFMVFSSDIAIVQDNNIFYVRSRGIRHFKSFDELLDEQAFCFLPDGRLALKVGEIPIKGLGHITEIADFFKDRDSNLSNFGIQLHTGQAFKIDNEKALELDESEERFEDGMKSFATALLGKDITQCDWYLQEKAEMRVKLAAVDFSVIEQVLRRYITSNQLESTLSLMQRLQAQGMEGLEEPIAALQASDPREFGVDKIAQMLRSTQVSLASDAKMPSCPVNLI